MSLFYLNLKSLGIVDYTEGGKHCVTTGPGWEMFTLKMANLWEQVVTFWAVQ